MAEQPDDLYVSCVDGQPVSRMGSPVLIGADRTLEGITYRPDEIVKIPQAEYHRYRREYTRQLTDGALVKRKPEEWTAQQKRDAEAQAKHEADKAERKKKREQEAAAATTKAKE